MNGHIEKLAPFEDEVVIKRVSGRIGYSSLFDFERKHPIILPGENVIAELIAKGVHKKLKHPVYLRVMAEGNI